MPPTTNKSPKKLRADVAVEMAQLAESRNKAQRLIMAGEIWLAGERIQKASDTVNIEDLNKLEHKQERQGYVGRGAQKLAPIITLANWQVTDKHCLDVGASTGGFTEVLLLHGAQTVTAIDVGYGQLHPRLRQDPRVIVYERLNFREWDNTKSAWQFDFAVMDVSFISVTLLLGPLAISLKIGAKALILIKPQFEVGKEAVPRGGVVRNTKDINHAIEHVKQTALIYSLQPLECWPAAVAGRKGNQEWFLHVEKISGDAYDK